MNDESAQRLAQIIFRDDQEAGDQSFPSISGYELHSVIGHGGGGVVYEGSVKSTARPVAIKVLHPRTTNSVSHALNELDRLASVRSPVVPHVFEHGWVGNQLYIVTELIEGQDPIEYAKNRSMKQKVALLASIADAVSALSSRGIIHRDLKPSNIMITREAKPVILDLGIATVLADDHVAGEGAAWEHERVAVGTAAYMSPEQALGRNEEVTTQWDVYALGAIAYQILTGSTPHGDRQTVTQALDASASAPILQPRKLNPILPKGLEAILLTACAHNPVDRYENPQQFRDDLNRWLNREPINAGKQSVWARMVRLTTRHPLITTSLAMLIIMGVSIASTLGIVWWQSFYAYRFDIFIGTNTGNITSLYSRSGNIIHTWQTSEANGIKFPGRVLSHHGKRYAILGFASPELYGANGLVGYRVGHYDEPVWAATQHIPTPMRYASRYRPEPDKFNFAKLYFFDVFLDEPGLELVSIHNYTPLSPSAIQIHRADGKLLSEYYHDGHLRWLYFEPTQSILYAAGPNSDGVLAERGVLGSYPGKYPMVVFAFRPKLGEVQQVIRHPDLEFGTDPLWYKCILPVHAYSTVLRDAVEVGVSLREPTQLIHRELGNIEIQLGAGTTEATLGQVNLIITPEGEVLESWANDSWTGTEHGWTADIFTLAELPPRIVAREFEQSETLPALPTPPESQAP